MLTVLKSIILLNRKQQQQMQLLPLAKRIALWEHSTDEWKHKEANWFFNFFAFGVIM